jgi:metal-dependent HD superfamily phosphatase/phosphodiesterase
VVLAAALHDVGLAIQPNGQPEAGLALASLKAKELLASLYSPRERTILVAEALQAIASHHHGGGGLTLEAGVLHLGDALDLAEARLRPAAGREPGAARPKLGAPAAGVQAVTIHKGAHLPIRVEVRLSDPASVPEVSRLLQRRLQEAELAALVEVAMRAVGGRPAVPLGQSAGEAGEP